MEDVSIALAGGGELGRRMRELDWSKTPLGPVERWPRSLLTAVSICLSSRFPILIWWGPQLVKLYNDAYAEILARKHPAALGRPGREVWPEIWPIIGPMLEGVLERGEATWSENQLLDLVRHGFAEECYFTFSYSPIRDESGGVGGVFTAVTETTRQVIGERRLSLLRTLSNASASASTIHEVCLAAGKVFEADPHDVPFTGIFARAPDGTYAYECGSGKLPEVAWPFERVAQTRAPEVAAGAMVLPIAQDKDELAGFLVAGLSPRLPLDDRYRDFLALAAEQVGTAFTRVRALAEARAKADALAELDKAKTAFFSNVSHEFRTPLTLILGPLEDALHHARSLDGEALSQVHRNALRLLRLVNALLDFSRIEAGRAQARFRPVALGKLTADLASAFRAAAERAGLTFEVKCEETDELAWVDPELWEKIVLNLVSNAFKFTLSGGIRVEVSRAGGNFVLSVADTGSGIPKAELAKLFTRFHRVEGAKARTHEGSGIGLALVQELVKLHGGEISVDSEVNRGTTFTVSIPKGFAHLPEEHRAPEPEPGMLAPSRAKLLFGGEAELWKPTAETRGSGARIVVADDNADLRAYLSRVLSEAGYAVTAVPGGEEALAELRRERPALLLCDVMMPGLDGFGVLSRVRTDEKLSDLPVVMLSARAGDEARVEGIVAGADDYLVKPFSARELVARVALHVELGQMRQRLRADVARRDDFLAMLGHELRNPLGSIALSIGLLARRRPELSKDRNFQVLENQSRGLARIVDDLLEVARVTSGRIRLQSEPLDLSEVARAQLEAALPSAQQRRQQLDGSAPPGLWVHGDRVRLEQVIGNLLSNAIRYTPEGGHIALSARRDDGAIEVSVRDDGVGIRPEMLESIFGLFVQADTTLSRERGGLGVGLAVVRRLVEMHGGTVSAFSEGEGRGSTFTVRLPAAAAPIIVPAMAQAPKTAAPRRRVLVVDDNVDAASMLSALLEHEGYPVRVASNGVSAIEAAREWRPEAVVLDIGLPDIDGYRVANAIRGELGGNVLLLALTGYGQRSDKDRAMAAGFDFHVVKPPAPEQLLSLLASGRPQ